MKTAYRLKAQILRLIIISTIILFTASCKESNPIDNSLKNGVFNKNKAEETEAYFFIKAANVSNSIISKSLIAQQKCSENTILELSRKIADHQEKLQQEVKKLANKRMVVITEINAAHKRDLYDLIDADNANCEEVYLNSVTESIKEQIELLEKISKETDDQPILKLVLQYLPDQYKLLRETESFKK